MNSIPDKCTVCERAVTTFEEIHKGWCKFEYEAVTRCYNIKNMPAYIVGCVCAEQYCDKKEVQI